MTCADQFCGLQIGALWVGFEQLADQTTTLVLRCQVAAPDVRRYDVGNDIAGTVPIDVFKAMMARFAAAGEDLGADGFEGSSRFRPSTCRVFIAALADRGPAAQDLHLFINRLADELDLF